VCVDGEWLAARCEDLAGDRITIAWTTDDLPDSAQLEPGHVVRLIVCAPNDALYASTAAVESVRCARVPIFHLRVTGAWLRAQRRNAVRQQVAVRPRLARVVNGSTPREVRLGVVDVSATGVRVRSRDELRANDFLELAFELDGEVQVRARVRHVEPRERAWEAGCEFEGISDAVAQRIVHFIFAEQRAILRHLRGRA
jgi:c-di-GMP-binding flagellar brake protein YcgR